MAGDRPLICDAKDKVCTFKGKILNVRQNATIFVDREDNRCDESDITKVVFTACSIHYIPSELFSIFENLGVLEMKSDYVKEIRPGTFNNANSLTILELHSNKIRRLHPHNFKGATSLIHIKIQSNQIEEVDELTFQGMQVLELIYLCSNRLKEIHKNTFKNLKKLKELSLNSNQIEFLPPNLFSDNLNLMILHLRTNHFTSISGQIFSHLLRLNELYMNGNFCIDKVYSSKAFSAMETIKKDLSNCTMLVMAEKDENFLDLKEVLNNLSQRLNLIEKSVEKIDRKTSFVA
jgi:Leucine-rich repeat (LRR) protein